MNRRKFLGATLATAAVQTPWARALTGTPDPRTLFAISSMPRNGGIRLLKHFLSLTGKPKPKLLLLATAVGDDPRWIDFWAKQLVPQVDCEFEAMRLFGDSANMSAFHPRIMGADAIFVAGGNTLNAIAVWKAQGIDSSLRAAWNKGTVMGGESAGMICWFEQGLSDSRPERLSVIDGLGWLPGSACPHFENGARRDLYRELVGAGKIATGVGADAGTGLLYRGTQLAQAISIDASYRVLRLSRGATGADESNIGTTII